jgi:cell division protein FtsL
MIDLIKAKLGLYLGLAGVLLLLTSYAVVYDAGYRARATRDRTDLLQAQLDAATKDKQRLELAAKMTADETRLLAQYRQQLQERVHDLETELTSPRPEPAQVAVRPVSGPVALAQCPVLPDIYLASPADIRRLQQARGGQRKPAARPGVRSGDRPSP